MAHRAEQLLQPRSYVLSGNEEALVLQSTTPETRLTFLNSVSDASTLFPRYAFSFSNQEFNILAGANQVAATFRPHKYIPNEREIVLYGSTQTSNVSLIAPTTKGIILQDNHPTSANVFTGFGVDGNAVTYQLPSRLHKHVFRAAAYDGANIEWMRIQENSMGVVQVGIGTTSLLSTEALAVKGDARVVGNLHITGALNLDNSPFLLRNTTTNKLDQDLMPENVALLNADRKLDESIIPQSFNFQFLRAQKNVGIGTRYPSQKLHVWGSTIVSERLGIGTITPLSRIHIVEASSVIPAMYIENNGGGEGIRVHVNANSVPAFVVRGSHNGVGISTDVVGLENSLEVGGNAKVKGTFTCDNLVLNNKVSAKDVEVATDDFGVVFKMEVLQDQFGNPTTQIRGKAKFTFENGISTDFITTMSRNLHVRNAGLRVDLDGTFIGGIISGSDMRHKYNIERIQNATTKLESIRGYTYRMGKGDIIEAGVLAQEVLRTFPEAVCVRDPEFYGVRYNAIIALLLEGYHEMNKRVRAFERCGV